MWFQKKKEDDFGANDEDWDVYREIVRNWFEINAHGSQAIDQEETSDIEAEDQRMMEIDDMINKYGKQAVPELSAEQKLELLAQENQLHLTVERIQIPEVD